MHSDFGTVITAAVTPFDATGDINLPEFRALLRHLADNGSDAVVVCGTTGESPTLSSAEKLKLIDIAVEELRDHDTHVIAGTGSNDTAASVTLSREAVRLGVDGLLIVVPYYNKPTFDGVFKHFHAIAQATHVPIIAYNIPGRTGINIEPKELAELSDIDNVVAVKEANPAKEQLEGLRKYRHEIDIYAGNDDCFLDALLAGGVGGILVASHVVGPQMQAIAEAVRNGDTKQAKALNDQLRPLYEVLGSTTNPIAIKAMLNHLGHNVGGLRLPLVEADSQVASHVSKVIGALKLKRTSTALIES